ncbi:hypothetical protein LQ327_08375 [Actinomycetospora endophytica]|uniref:Uncharacterized protein n=1 Tax=Actinomycetospora endophytica TaxID=2291215 RepID=A0ABS8P5J6_9PSEU|nr:hypothetical protein [Actinomycetospora endophytica]MCD2193399.1 hypothetical protein [Actinomycetospora endophytica]
MTHVPEFGRTPASAGPRALRRRTGCPRPDVRDRLIGELRSALAAAWIAEDPLPLEHLGAGPVRSRAEVLARVDSLAHELCERMDAEGWDPGAAPLAVTSVLAASVPAAEALLLRAAARPDGRAREVR